MKKLKKHVDKRVDDVYDNYNIFHGKAMIGNK